MRAKFFTNKHGNNWQLDVYVVCHTPTPNVMQCLCALPHTQGYEFLDSDEYFTRIEVYKPRLFWWSKKVITYELPPPRKKSFNNE
jgi:hypothetical protein